MITTICCNNNSNFQHTAGLLEAITQFVCGAATGKVVECCKVNNFLELAVVILLILLKLTTLGDSRQILKGPTTLSEAAAIGKVGKMANHS